MTSNCVSIFLNSNSNLLSLPIVLSWYFEGVISKEVLLFSTLLIKAELFFLIKKKEPIITDIFHTWKLEGFGDTSDNSFKNADPKDCEECFVIIFYEDSTFRGKSIINLLGKNFIMSGNNLSFPGGVLSSYVQEISGDGTRFTDSLKKVNKYSIEKSKLKLFYSDNEYLLFYLKS